MTLVILLALIMGCSDDKEEATDVPPAEPSTGDTAPVVELSEAEQWAKDNSLVLFHITNLDFLALCRTES